MQSNRNTKKRNFTLIELMVVVIIVAILAAAAVPIYLAQSRRAKTAEAVAGLGAIRSVQRVYYAEKSAYLAITAGNISNNPEDTDVGLGLDFGTNTYFDDNCFAVTISGATFVATCDGTDADNASPRASDVTKISVRMNEKGQLSYRYGASDASWSSYE
ncbi:MAG: prepilin-type N-terminal cleavage/methylation domain-containing protein [Lentisphaerae bacterium]|jgi:prepilin-type N-terminal cleavage/methylation domain-containing protein|nr:prepilin-type N-terminal cleavage/methylation domain-containing protein [Lentisphaerota bacterium]MBT4817564.1 prepilin-type N-terminal cleavage/methylation domain-containing protein [Lentisphaerota bacterium]MBT5610140.1 prepilin-type N-terminal cleavage/methylation domain-containing protein [Lentisphaerota bacterium]MBT7057369.1 prepilin-type N-terminal cleavage/methylation domain-containing protein [Lentisphaerota bacterium]MBT7842128.1 prepilin-type N-terminal cleavage/methylation domain